MKLIVYFVRLIFWFVNLVTPKFNNKIVIHSMPDFDDMTRALVLHMPKEYVVVVLTHKLAVTPDWLADNEKITIRVCKKASISGLVHYLTARHVFFTHGCFSSVKPVKRQISVNVWHGMPIKSIGGYLNEEHEMPKATYHVASSDFYQKVIAKAFSCNENVVEVTGLPRSDILVNKEKINIKPKLCKNGEKLILWLPTYRQSTFGDVRLDGVQRDNVYGLDFVDEDRLNEKLKSVNAKLYVKPHPMAVSLIKGDPFSNIIFINEEWLNKNNTTLYEMLAVSDCLISDVSSVIIDYQLVGKPIICCFQDVTEYSKSRGLIPGVKLDELTSVIVNNQSELESVLESIDFDSAYTLNRKFHRYPNGFTRRLLGRVNIVSNIE